MDEKELAHKMANAVIELTQELREFREAMSACVDELSSAVVSLTGQVARLERRSEPQGGAQRVQ